MKKNNILRIALLACCVSLGFFAQLMAETSYYPKQVFGNQIVDSIIVMEDESTMTKFYYDAEGNAIQKQVLKSDDYGRKWEKKELYDFQYNSQGLPTQELLSLWNVGPDIIVQSR